MGNWMMRILLSWTCQACGHNNPDRQLMCRRCAGPGWRGGEK